MKQRIIDYNTKLFIASKILNVPKEKIIIEKIPLPGEVYSIEKKIEEGTPLEYLLNKCWFMGYEFYIEPGVFIPRPETEELVERIFKRIEEAKFIFEVGTGTGCISIVLALKFKNSNIIASEIDDTAYRVSKKNVKNYGLEKRIRIYKTSVFEIPQIEQMQEKFDLVVSNPPYISEDELLKLSFSVKNYESITALNGGKDGVEIIEKIIRGAKVLLKEKGLLAIEITERNVERIREILKREDYKEFNIERDLAGNIRFLFVKK